MLRIVAFVALAGLGGCRAFMDHDTGPFECPAEEDRFVPMLETSDQFTGDTATVRCEPVDGTGSRKLDFAKHSIFECTSSMCADGYVGPYCLSSRLGMWALAKDPDDYFGLWCSDDYPNPPSSLRYCHAYCTPGYEEPE